VRAEPIQPYLDEHTALLEYFIARGRLIAFVVTRSGVQARLWPSPLPSVENALGLLRLNVRATAAGLLPPESLAANALGLLGRLHNWLLEPVLEAIQGCGRLIIVPHGPLHYVPFHALHDGSRYLLEGCEVSYLPGGSFLRYTRRPAELAAGLLAVGHSLGGRLPYAVREAQAVAGRWPGATLLEAEATRAAFQQAAGRYGILHLATHAEFRADNPLFSGLALHDGALTTLDVFSLRLRASLVCLSACRTGRNVIGGGDELLGLMRAFLSSGAISLLLTLWAVEDRSTAALMEAFYDRLAAGERKAAALRHAQLGFLQSGSEFAHPSHWAPFFLVGEPGPL
jgi:CHAT domain-containing protein